MSMLTRKGTMSFRRSQRRKANMRRSSKSQSSSSSGGPTSPVLKNVVEAERNSVTTQVSQEDKKILCKSEVSQDLGEGDAPGYGSIIYQIREANEEAEGLCDFCSRVAKVVACTSFTTVALATFLGLPFCMIIIGVQYLHECPKEIKIPTYLLIGGCFGIVKLLTLLWQQIRSLRYASLDGDLGGDGDDLFTSKSSQITEIVLSVFLLIWFALGNFWVFSIYKPNFTPPPYEPTNWCSKTVYLFALAQIGICYSVIIFICVLLGVLTLFARATRLLDKPVR